MTNSKNSDRSRVVKTTLRAPDMDDAIKNATPGERMGMVWQLTLDAWAFMDPESAQSEFQRHTVRIQRGKR